MDSPTEAKRFNTLPVFLTAISTIVGAILFLRFGFAVGTLGFWGALLIIILGHSLTIPTALAISELATNKRVEGGGEYFIMSRSFGLNIGATIGLALYLSQAISIPAMLVPGFVILKNGAGTGVKMLYVVTGILLLSLILFFLGTTDHMSVTGGNIPSGDLRNMNRFFMVFAIVFPAFTGMTAGVGLSRDLKNPARSIPLGTIIATVSGLLIYLLVIYKLSVSASSEDMLAKQLIMSDIAIWVMFRINAPYAFASLLLMTIVYLVIKSYHRERDGLESLFATVLFQINRNIQVYLQKSGSRKKTKEWRPSAICISKDSFVRSKAFNLLNWISYRYGFGTYLHRIDGYYSKATTRQADEELSKLIDFYQTTSNHVYIDTLISP